jgi:hypothetical protein
VIYFYKMTGNYKIIFLYLGYVLSVTQQPKPTMTLQANPSKESWEPYLSLILVYFRVINALVWDSRDKSRLPSVLHLLWTGESYLTFLTDADTSPPVLALGSSNAARGQSSNNPQDETYKEQLRQIRFRFLQSLNIPNTGLTFDCCCAETLPFFRCVSCSLSATNIG